MQTRTAAEKVALIERVEAKFHQHIVDGKIHDDVCRCHLCFQKMLDRAVEMSDKFTDESAGN